MAAWDTQKFIAESRCHNVNSCSMISSCGLVKFWFQDWLCSLQIVSPNHRILTQPVVLFTLSLVPSAWTRFRISLNTGSSSGRCTTNGGSFLVMFIPRGQFFSAKLCDNVFYEKNVKNLGLPKPWLKNQNFRFWSVKSLRPRACHRQAAQMNHVTLAVELLGVKCGPERGSKIGNGQHQLTRQNGGFESKKCRPAILEHRNMSMPSSIFHCTTMSHEHKWQMGGMTWVRSWSNIPIQFQCNRAANREVPQFRNLWSNNDRSFRDHLVIVEVAKLCIEPNK